jgi:AraC-like DNA-binding protein
LQFSNGGAQPQAIILDVLPEFEQPSRSLLSSLPDLVHVRAEDHGLHTVPTLLLASISSNDSLVSPGCAAVLARIADILFAQCVRVYLQAHVGDAKGWLRGLMHPRIGRALQAIHQAPGNDWTVATLATQAGMSRSLFSREFFAHVGQTPIHYLTEWRMHIAGRRLASGVSMHVVSEELGYASPITLSRAFKRLKKVNPRCFQSTR